MKAYQGKTDFENIRHYYDPKSFQVKHHYENPWNEEPRETVTEQITDDEQLEDQENYERIRLPNGNWINRNVLTRQQADTLQFDDEHVIEHPLRQEQDLDIDNDEIIEGEECALEECRKPTTHGTQMIQCIHCSRRFHIRCIGISELRAKEENYICNECEQASTSFSRKAT